MTIEQVLGRASLAREALIGMPLIGLLGQVVGLMRDLGGLQEKALAHLVDETAKAYLMKKGGVKPEEPQRPRPRLIGLNDGNVTTPFPPRPGPHGR